MIKPKLSYLLLISSSLGCASIKSGAIYWDPFRDMRRALQELDEAFNSSAVPLQKHEAESVELPEMSVKKEGDAAVIQIKGLTLKSDEIKSYSVEDEDDYGRMIRYVEYSFPHKDSAITLKVYPRGVSLKGEKKITNEKKDPKGKVLSSSSYTVVDSRAESLPIKVNVEKAKRELKDGSLTITVPSRLVKTAI